MVSLGGELEWPGSPLTVRLTSMKPFSTTPKKVVVEKDFCKTFCFAYALSLSLPFNQKEAHVSRKIS